MDNIVLWPLIIRPYLIAFVPSVSQMASNTVPNHLNEDSGMIRFDKWVIQWITCFSYSPFKCLNNPLESFVSDV